MASSLKCYFLKNDKLGLKKNHVVELYSMHLGNYLCCALFLAYLFFFFSQNKILKNAVKKIRYEAILTTRGKKSQFYNFILNVSFMLKSIKGFMGI